MPTSRGVLVSACVGRGSRVGMRNGGPGPITICHELGLRGQLNKKADKSLIAYRGI